MTLSRPIALIGSRFQDGKIELLDVLGEGGFGTVFLARVGEVQRAVKFVDTESWPEGNRDAFEALLESETAFLEELNHPVLPSFDHSFREGPLCGLVMEPIFGPTLRDHVEAQGPLPFDDFLQLSTALLDVLSYIHEEELIYGDIKPSNVIRSKDGGYRLVDLGSVWEMGEELPGRLNIISPNFTAPERTESMPSDYRQDLYSLAATLYFALTGVEAEIEMSFQSLEGVLRMSIGLLEHGLDEQRWHRFEKFLTLLLAALEPDPRSRPKSILNFQEALDRILVPS